MKYLACVLSTFALMHAVPAHAAIITYSAALSGLNEAFPNASTGIGQANVTIDDVGNTMLVDVNFSGLLSPTTAAHIHCCTTIPLEGTAGVATAVPNFPGFPIGVTLGGYNRVFDLLAVETYNPAFVTNNGGTTAFARAALLAGLAGGNSYLNIHSTMFPGGEIRGFLVAEATTCLSREAWPFSPSARRVWGYAGGAGALHRASEQSGKSECCFNFMACPETQPIGHFIRCGRLAAGVRCGLLDVVFRLLFTHRTELR